MMEFFALSNICIGMDQFFLSILDRKLKMYAKDVFGTTICSANQERDWLNAIFNSNQNLSAIRPFILIFFSAFEAK